MYNNSTYIWKIPAANYANQFYSTMYTNEEKMITVVYIYVNRNMQTIKNIIQKHTASCLIQLFSLTFVKLT